MPLLSVFTPTGFLECSSRQPMAQTIYESLISSYGGNYSVAAGSREDCTAYAQAMAIAAARLTMERAGNQSLPDKVLELMPVREAEMGITPGPYDTVGQRSDTLVARTKLPLGAARVNISNALHDLLGSDFIEYRPTPYSEAVLSPATIGSQPMNLQLPSVPRKLVQINGGISTGLGSPQVVTYSDITPNAAQLTFTTLLLNGDKLVVDPGNPSLAETVTVSAAGTGFLGNIFTATFNNPHDPGVIATTQPYPKWTSTKRHSLIVLTTTAASDPEKRRKVDELMARISRGISTWNICDGTSTSTNGPFKVGQGLIGVTTIGAVALP